MTYTIIRACSLSRATSPAARRARRPLIAALLTAVATLAACQSPLGPDAAGNSRYSESLLARAIIDSSSPRDVLQTPTHARPVREIVRVDDPGPASSSRPAATMAVPTAPTTAAATQAGYSSSQLNHSENPFELSLHDAIARAVKNSLAIKVEGYNTAIKEAQIIEAMANFDAVFFGQSQWTNTDDPLLQAGSLSNGQTWNNSVGIKQTFSTGAQAQVSTGVTYRDVSIPPGGVNSLDFKSSYSSNINLQVTQPLLRGFGTTVNEANIYLAQRDQRISLATFRRQVITTVADTEEAYYNLVVAQTNVRTVQRLVAASAQTYQTILGRLPLDANQASVNQALSALQSRRADLVRAQRDYRQASDALKNLLNDPELDIREYALLVPTDQPVAEPIYYSTADCITRALQQRTEIEEARLQVERADIVITVSRNNLLPKLDLIAGLQTNGLDEGFDKAYSATIDPGHFIDFSAGIKFEMPIGNRGPEAEFWRRKAERNQALTQMMRIALTVVADVKQRMREMLTNFELIDISDQARLAAAREFASLVDLESIRPMTPEFLQLELDSQARLASSEQTLTRAIVDYNIAIMRLEQSMGTLLEYNQISLDRPPIDRNEDAGKFRLLGKTYSNK